MPERPLPHVEREGIMGVEEKSSVKCGLFARGETATLFRRGSWLRLPPARQRGLAPLVDGFCSRSFLLLQTMVSVRR